MHVPRRAVDPALVVIAAGVCAALHVGKLPPALAALRQALDLSLVQAGFLLSLVQGAGMLLGAAFGAWADGLGPRRSMLIGLLVLGAASAAGGASGSAAAMMAWRVLEGFGFLLVVLPAPGLVRALVTPARSDLMLGVWSCYMPLATALALLLGPLCVAAWGWRAWWWALAALSLAMAVVLALAVPAPAPSATPAAPFAQRLRATLAAPAPWLVAASFAAYSGQWLAVVGFLPALYAAAGVAPAVIGPLTALVAAVNMAGNLAGGRLLHRGWPPVRLLALGFASMGLAALATYGEVGGQGLPPALRYAAVLAFSGVGGVIPATLFALAVRAAPGPGLLATTVGWVQQWSALGQFAGPPLVAWVASRAEGWQLTWVATGACCGVGLGLAAALGRWQARTGA
jgi:MFS family permease